MYINNVGEDIRLIKRLEMFKGLVKSTKLGKGI